MSAPPLSGPPTARDRIQSAIIATVAVVLFVGVSAVQLTRLQQSSFYHGLESTLLGMAIPYVLFLAEGGYIWYVFVRQFEKTYRPYPRVSGADSSRVRRLLMRWCPPIIAAEAVGVAIGIARQFSWELLPGLSLGRASPDTWSLLGVLVLLLGATLWTLEFAALREHETTESHAETTENDHTSEQETDRSSLVD